MAKFEHDKYYTPQDIVDSCVKLVKETIDEEIDCVIEPSAGNGSFIEAIEENFKNSEKIYLDLYPDDDRIIEQDYLKYSYHFNNDSVLVLGNPPFGGINLYKQFFNNSTKFAKYIAFILPISQLNNDNVLYQFDLIKSIDLGVRDYSNHDGDKKKVNCCFNIYKRPLNGLNKKGSLQLEGVEILNICKSKAKNFIDTKVLASENCIRLNGWGRRVGYFKDQNREQYANEYIIKSNNPEVIEFCKNFNWREMCTETSTSSYTLSKWRVAKVIKENFPELVKT